jgi:hypothetical protein
MGAGGTRGFVELDQLLQGHICSGHPFPLAGLSPYEAHYVFDEAMAWFRVAYQENEADPAKVLGPALERCARLLVAINPYPEPDDDDELPPHDA